jgi:hypothetical protein
MLVVHNFHLKLHIAIGGVIRMTKSIIFAVFIVLASAIFCFSADDTIGLVTEGRGKAWVVREGQQQTPEVGFTLRINDILKTSRDGAIGVILNDETVMSIGPNSELTISEYVFNPEQSQFSILVKMVRGTAAYVSGLIAKISPASARFVTPSASIGFRGTKMVVQVENDKGIL